MKDPLARLVFAGSVLTAVAFGALALPGVWQQHPVYAVGTVLVTGSLLVTGQRLTRRGRGRRAGLWVLAGAALWPAYWADMGQASLGPFGSWVAENAVWCVFGTAFLAYPSEPAWSRTERRFLVVLWASVACGALALTLVSRPEWLGASAWWPDPWPTRAGLLITLAIFGLGRLLLAAIGTHLVVARLRAASGLNPSLLRPALVGLVLSMVVVVVTGVVQQLTTDEAVNAAAQFVQGLSLIFLPAVLLLSVVRTRLVRVDMVDRVMRLSRPATTESVEAALRAALHDETLEVVFERREQSTQQSTEQSPQPRRPPDATLRDDRYVVPVLGSDGRRIAAVACDPRLREHGSLVETAVQVAGLELENVMLHAGLRTQMDELRASQARLVKAGQFERRRLERDLHDGAQQHMLAIALQVEHARVRADEPETRRSLQQIKDEMQGALAEIRDLARGIQPGLLIQGGLRPAVLAITDGMPLPVRIDIPAQRYPQQAESAAYFVASEALSNIVKHSGAGHASVTICAVDGQLTVTVTDDGSGGARMTGGSGLRGLMDRIRALGGRVEVSGHPGAGSRVEARIPCG